jgi:hypothetical protein
MTQKYDADGDGTISADELYQVMLGCGVQLTPQQLQDIIKEQDTDGDGTLRPEEFVKFWLTAAEKFSMEKTRKRMKEAFLVSNPACSGLARGPVLVVVTRVAATTSVSSLMGLFLVGGGAYRRNSTRTKTDR